MSISCSVVVRTGNEVFQFYKKENGSPNETGNELHAALVTEDIIFFLRSNPAYKEESYITVHGDIDYIYKIHKGTRSIDTVEIKGRSASKWAYAFPNE